MAGRGESFDDAPQKQEKEQSHTPQGSSSARTTLRSLEEEIARLSAERQRLTFAQRIGRIGTFEWEIPNKRITWTPELEALYGLPPDGLGGSYERWKQRIHPDDLAQAEESLRRAVRGEAPYEAEFRVIWPDGSVHWLLAKGDLQLDEGRGTRRVIGVNIDITERKEAEEQLAAQTALLQAAHRDLQNLNANLEAMIIQRTQEYLETAETLRQLNAELERSNQELQDFAHVASHDLQEPLRKIQAFGNLLEDEYGPELGEGKAYLDRMRLAASRMQRLINDLLTFARVTTRARPFLETDLNIIVQEAIDDLEASVRAHRGEIEVGPLPTIEADPLQMRQVFQNLIGNALKFHKPDVPPHVRISAEISNEAGEDSSPERQFCTIRVEDNGIGFDEKYLDRIFTVFQRLHGREQYEGTGVGLAVVRKIIARHNGTITAQSTQGVGSTFIIVLPTTQTIKDTEAYVE